MSVTTTLEAAAAVVIVTVASTLLTWTVPRKMLRIATVITSTAVVVIIAVPSIARTLSRHVSHSVTIVAHDTTGTVTAAVVSPAVVVAFPVSTKSSSAATTSSTVIVVATVVIGVVVLRRVNGGATGSSDVKCLVFSVGFELDIELNGLVLVQRAVAVGFDGFLMNEQIGATVVGPDEAVTLGTVEPRDLASRSRELRHCRWLER